MTRFGRVGSKGEVSCFPSNELAATKKYAQLKRKKMSKGYSEVEVEFKAEEEEDVPVVKSNKKQKASKLDQGV